MVHSEIVRRVKTLFARADQFELRLAKAREQVCKLTPSLQPTLCSGATTLTRAFAGKRVRQKPDDEPASMLLERVARQRSSGDAGGKQLHESQP